MYLPSLAPLRGFVNPRPDLRAAQSLLRTKPGQAILAWRSLLSQLTLGWAARREKGPLDLFLLPARPLAGERLRPARPSLQKNAAQHTWR